VSFLSDKLMASDAPSGICGREEQTAVTGTSAVPPAESGLALGRSRELGVLVRSLLCHKRPLHPPCPCSPAWQLAVTTLLYVGRVL